MEIIKKTQAGRIMSLSSTAALALSFRAVQAVETVDAIFNTVIKGRQCGN